MINIKRIFIRIWLFTLSPVFPILLGWSIFIVYRIYSDPIITCDDNGYLLYELKRSLTKEIANFRLANIECALYKDLQEQETKFSLLVRTTDLDREEELANNFRDSISKMQESLSKVKDLETSIIKIEPGFKSRISFN
jgi:hypothetical protein